MYNLFVLWSTICPTHFAWLNVHMNKHQTNFFYFFSICHSVINMGSHYRGESGNPWCAGPVYNERQQPEIGVPAVGINAGAAVRILVPFWSDDQLRYEPRAGSAHQQHGERSDYAVYQHVGEWQLHVCASKVDTGHNPRARTPM